MYYYGLNLVVSLIVCRFGNTCCNPVFYRVVLQSKLFLVSPHLANAVCVSHNGQRPALQLSCLQAKVRWSRQGLSFREGVAVTWFFGVIILWQARALGERMHQKVRESWLTTRKVATCATRARIVTVGPSPTSSWMISSPSWKIPLH